jgi:hypothetical protein
MINKWKTRDIAARIVRHHGEAARAIVEAKWKEYGTAGDGDGVEQWVEIGIEVAALLEANPSLASVLEGATTKTMMEADGVTRHDLDTLMKDAKTKQR